MMCALVVVILTYLLGAPFYFEINSKENVCRIRFHKLATVRIYFTEKSLFLELRAMGCCKSMDLLISRKKQAKRDKTTAKSSLGISFPKIRAIVRSFRLSECSVSLNTRDMALNGILFPWFLWIGRLIKKDIRINFYNETEIALVAKNNFYRILWAYVFN